MVKTSTGLIQTQEQRLVQQQRLSAQQILQTKLLEMPLAELEENVRTEIDDNPALDIGAGERDDFGEHAARGDEADDYGERTAGGDEADDFEQEAYREERQQAMTDALERFGSDDEMPVARAFYADDAEREQMVYGDQTSFYDTLREQMGELSLTERQQQAMEYIIGSLDSDGLLRKDFSTLSDELALYHNIYIGEDELSQVADLLKGFDPPGIGAASLQECLLLQVRRKMENREGSPATLRLMEEVIADHFDDFTRNNWHDIAEQMGMSAATAQEVQREILRLNPKPGASMGETEGRSTQQVTPDFIVETDDSGHVSFTVNGGRVPDLAVSPMFADIVKGYQQKKSPLNRQEKEAYVYAKDKIERAQGYITALQQRRHTLYVTMKTIIDWQRKFFEFGDDNDLRPMVLKDIAERTGLDISTISRVCNSKYCQTRWGIFRLRHFFSEGVKTADGEELSVYQIKNELQDIIDHEDKHHPLSDEELALRLKERGLPIARRTVAKYRDQLAIPAARMRRA